MQSVEADRMLAATAVKGEIAWGRIVDENVDRLWQVARSAGLTGTDAAQVCQLAWLRLTQRLPELTPGEIPGWLEGTVRREAGALAAHRLEQARRRDPAGSPDNVIALTPGFCDAGQVGAQVGAPGDSSHGPVSGVPSTAGLSDPTDFPDAPPVAPPH